ncbi:hypothetical protein HPB48_009828 [Haemaphysalis longicornis]|uniref:Peptidase M13 N-terminal domain-containing protein n=1 Tax=Haemaphysalis longicornis TaxID=44386 RepID=A0A9J6FWU5_HAELO|nr:hypothetical protein HPB48_009828 [Haemaphysalis longicornis]
MTSWFKSLEGVLRSGAQQTEAGRKPLNMLQACTSQKTWNPSDLRDFKNFLAKLHLSWPEPPPKNVSALGVLLDLIYNWKLCFWFQIRVLKNFKRNGTHRIVLTPGATVELYLFAFNHHNLVANGSYSQHWTDHERLFVDNGSVAQNIALAKKIANEEKKIIDTLLSVANKQVIIPTIIPLSDLGNYTNAVDSTEWIHQINDTINIGDSFTLSDEVLVSDPSLLEAIGHLFDTFGDQEIIYHLSWQFVQTYAHIVDRNLLKSCEIHIAETICQRHVQMAYNPLIVTMYVRLHPPEWRHTRLRANFELIMRQASKKVNGSSWLDAKSKEASMVKLKDMVVQTWPNKDLLRDMAQIYSTFPDGGREAGNSSFVHLWIKTRESLRALAATPFHDLICRFRPVPLPMLVAYDYFTNEVDVAVAALGRPVYYENGTFAMFYGGIGFLFALEVMKMQDALGVRLHPNGTVVSSWITRDSRLQFQDQKRCSGEASNSSSHQLLPTAVPALEVTYAAFSSAVAHSNQSLQLSRELTEPKVFFMTLCLMLCGTNSSKGEVVDCNLLLRNSHSFPDAFQCAPGTKMNPVKKCKYFDT